jgi:hypothetical protein
MGLDLDPHHSATRRGLDRVLDQVREHRVAQEFFGLHGGRLPAKAWQVEDHFTLRGPEDSGRRHPLRQFTEVDRAGWNSYVPIPF